MISVDKALVFVRTKHGADRLVEQLGKEGVRAGAIHGDVTAKPHRLHARHRGDLVQDLLAVGDVVEHHLEVELLRDLHRDLDLVPLVSRQHDGALAAFEKTARVSGDCSRPREPARQAITK